MKSWSIRRQLLFNALMPAAVVAVLLATTLLAGRFADLDEAHLDHGTGLARNIAASAEYSIFSGNRTALERLVAVAIQDADVAAVGIFSAGGEPLAWQGTGEVPPADEVTQAAAGFRHYTAGTLLRMLVPILAAPVSADPVADALIAAPARGTPVISGYVLLDMSRADVARRKGHVLITGIVIIFVSLGLAALMAVRISERISQPVQGLIEVVDRIGAGELAARVTPQASTHSLRRLEDGVNAMAARIGMTQDHLRQEIDAATGELQRQKAAAENVALVRTRILATASHDLRQPLHALGMFVARLKQFDHPHKVADLVAYIDTSVGALGALLDSLLDISKLDADQVKAYPTKFPIRDLLTRLREDFAEQATQHGLRFSVRPARWWIVSDPVLLERILRNLITNAIRYTSRGGILVGARRRGGQLRIEVWDTGRGIAPESQQAVFREFVQVGEPPPGESRGLGLGLAIVDRTARLLGHPVGLVSRPGRGSMFHVTVPLTAPAESVVPPTSTRGLPAMTVVVVDDDLMVRQGMQEMLEGWGCTSIAAVSGDAALARLAPDTVPDLLLCDYRLSAQENGFAVVRRFRERFGAALPAIMMTGETDTGVAFQADALRLPLLHKPVSPPRLRALLQRLAASERGGAG